MLTFSTEERLALLLNVLGDEATDAAMTTMNPTQANFVKQLLAEYKMDPPSAEEVEFVVNDFNKFFSFALETLAPQLEEATEGAAAGKKKKKPVPAAASAGDAEIETFPVLKASDDPVADLNKLNPYQIAVALEMDHPKTVAMVLRYLNTSLAAAVIEDLPESTRTDCVVFLSQPSTVPDRIVQQVLESTFERGNSVLTKKNEVDQADSLAQLMRSLPKEMRKEMIERLTEENEELVNAVRSKLYVFDDILRLDDRDVQKLLGEVETDNLIVGLQRAEKELLDRILGNLSKRAKETIEEEMQYKTGVTDDEVDAARQTLVEAIGRLDEAGEITLN
jgi:flagellar motor switch protein FliG